MSLREIIEEELDKYPDADPVSARTSATATSTHVRFARWRSGSYATSTGRRRRWLADADASALV
jgi:hypothetical protein